MQKKELPSEKEFLAENEIQELHAGKGIAFRKRNRLQKKELRNSLQKKDLRNSFQKKEFLAEKEISCRKRNCFERGNSLQKKESPSEKEFLAEKGIGVLLAEKGIAFRKRNRLQKKESRNSFQKKELPSGKGIPLKKKN